MSREYVTDKIKQLPYSGIRKFFDVAAEMEDVISLGVGEPDFFTPWHVREEAIFSLERRRTVYTSNAGQLELRREISGYLENRFGLHYHPKTQIVVTVGASEGIDLVLRAILNTGDEVLLVEPCYVSYKPCILMAGGVPVIIPAYAENQFRITAKDIEAKITDKTKAILFCYPNNPTGAIMERSDLEDIAEVLRSRDILIISDEIYAELTYAGEGHVSIASLPGMYERTVVLNGFSKAYAMTGWRLGYACGPVDIIAAMIKIHQYVIMCAPTTAQHAGVEALKNGHDGVVKMRREYDARRRFMLDGFAKIGIECFEPLGAFYLFPSIRFTGLTSEAFCNQLLQEERLAVVPGNAFGDSGEGHVRCAYAYSIGELKEALTRLERFVRQYGKG